MKLITGAGGGGKDGSGSGRVAQEAADTLQSKSYAQVLDLVSEGEIEGLVNGLRSVYLDDTPLIDDNGQSNFSGVTIDLRTGTQGQSYIPGFPSSENEVSVAVEVKHATPVVRAITNEDIDAINVRVSTPQLTYQDPTNGDLLGAEVSFVIEVNSNHSGWVQKASDTFIGKTTSKYIRDYRIDLDGEGPHEIRVRKVTEDSSKSNLQNKIYWDSYGEVIDVKLRYPNSAVVALAVDAENFKSIPTRAYDLKLMRIKVPSNYNPSIRSYNGIWDGTFVIAWSDNPAWIFYDLVTNERYGLGAHIDSSQVDKWGLYKIAQYCDELVPDGYGRYEPRFTCNAYFQSRAEAYSAINDLASVFRSMAYWAGGMLVLSQDSPQDAVHLFTSANVIDGEFQYQGTSRRDRYSVALVSWNDPDDAYKQKVEYVEDADAILRYGVVQKEFAAFGCTSRGQAHRLGKWAIYTSLYETETVTFQTGIEAVNLRPGEIFNVQDSMRAGQRLGGRVKVATSGSVTIDQDLVAGPFTREISVMLPSGKVETRQVQSIAERVVTVSGDFSEIPHVESVWLIASNDVEPQSFRVISVAEKDGLYSVTGLAHNPDKFLNIEQNVVLEQRSISILSPSPELPTGLKVTETLYEVNGEVRTKATFSWNAQSNAAYYDTSYRSSAGNIVSLGEGSANEVEILNIQPGDYDFFVTAISALGKTSPEASISYTILGKAFPPGSVIGFSMIPMADQAYLSWEKTIDLDVSLGGAVRIRHSPNYGAQWKDAVDLALLAGSSTRAQVPLMNGTYMAKFIDSSGNASDEPAYIETSATEASKLNLVMTMTEHPYFSGQKSAMMFTDFYGGLAISARISIDDWDQPIDDALAFDYLGGVADEGTYEFTQIADLSDVYTSNISALIDASAVDVADVIDMREDPMDTWQDMDGAFIDDVNAEMFVKTTEDDPASPSAVWSEWKRFFVGQYKARAFKFKLVATSKSLNHNIIIKKLSVSIDMPDRTEDFANLLSSTAGSEIVFEKPFREVPAIGITTHNGVFGDHFSITDKTESGFKIKFFDKDGVAVQRVFDVLAKGYGRKV